MLYDIDPGDLHLVIALGPIRAARVFAKGAFDEAVVSKGPLPLAGPDWALDNGVLAQPKPPAVDPAAMAGSGPVPTDPTLGGVDKPVPQPSWLSANLPLLLAGGAGLGLAGGAGLAWWQNRKKRRALEAAALADGGVEAEPVKVAWEPADEEYAPGGRMWAPKWAPGIGKPLMIGTSYQFNPVTGRISNAPVDPANSRGPGVSKTLTETRSSVNPLTNFLHERAVTDADASAPKAGPADGAAEAKPAPGDSSTVGGDQPEPILGSRPGWAERNWPYLLGGAALGGLGYMAHEHYFGDKKKEKRADAAYDAAESGASGAINWLHQNPDRAAALGMTTLGGMALVPTAAALRGGVSLAKAPKGYGWQSLARGAGIGAGAAMGATLAGAGHDIYGEPHDLATRLLLRLGGGALGGIGVSKLLGPPAYERDAEREKQKVAAEHHMGPLEALAASRAEGHQAPFVVKHLAAANYSDAGMPVRGAWARAHGAAHGGQQLTEGAKYVSPAMRRLSAPAGDSAGIGGDNLFEDLGYFSDPRNIGKARDAYAEKIAPYRDEPDPAPASEAQVEHALDVTPRTLMNAADVVGADAEIAGHRYNRHNRPGHYWLNPFVSSGPLSEIGARLHRRGAAEKADPDAAFRASLYVPGVPTARGLLGGHNPEKREKARALALAALGTRSGDDSAAYRSRQATSPIHFNKDSAEKQAGWWDENVVQPTGDAWNKNVADPFRNYVGGIAGDAAAKATSGFKMPDFSLPKWDDLGSWAPGALIGGVGGAGLGLLGGLSSRKKDKRNAFGDALTGGLLGAAGGGLLGAGWDVSKHLLDKKAPPEPAGSMAGTDTGVGPLPALAKPTDMSRMTGSTAGYNQAVAEPAHEAAKQLHARLTAAGRPQDAQQLNEALAAYNQARKAGDGAAAAQAFQNLERFTRATTDKLERTNYAPPAASRAALGLAGSLPAETVDPFRGSLAFNSGTNSYWQRPEGAVSPYQMAFGQAAGSALDANMPRFLAKSTGEVRQPLDQAAGNFDIHNPANAPEVFAEDDWYNRGLNTPTGRTFLQTSVGTATGAGAVRRLAQGGPEARYWAAADRGVTGGGATPRSVVGQVRESPMRAVWGWNLPPGQVTTNSQAVDQILTRVNSGGGTTLTRDQVVQALKNTADPNHGRVTTAIGGLKTDSASRGGLPGTVNASPLLNAMAADPAIVDSLVQRMAVRDASGVVLNTTALRNDILSQLRGQQAMSPELLAALKAEKHLPGAYIPGAPAGPSRGFFGRLFGRVQPSTQPQFRIPGATTSPGWLGASRRLAFGVGSPLNPTNALLGAVAGAATAGGRHHYGTPAATTPIEALLGAPAGRGELGAVADNAVWPFVAPAAPGAADVEGSVAAAPAPGGPPVVGRTPSIVRPAQVVKDRVERANPTSGIGLGVPPAPTTPGAGSQFSAEAGLGDKAKSLLATLQDVAKDPHAGDQPETVVARALATKQITPNEADILLQYVRTFPRGAK